VAARRALVPGIAKAMAAGWAWPAGRFALLVDHKTVALALARLDHKAALHDDRTAHIQHHARAAGTKITEPEALDDPAAGGHRVHRQGPGDLGQIDDDSVGRGQD